MSTAIVEKPLTYEEERGKPMPSSNHAVVQTNLICELAKNRAFRIASELTLDIAGKSYTPDLSAYSRKPVDFRHDVSKSSDPPLLVVEILSPQQGAQAVMD